MEAEFRTREKRKYCMTNQKARIRNPRERGEPRRQKVTLETVLCVLYNGASKQNCLCDINPKYILEQRYMAWVQKYEARATWIQQMLNAFFTRNVGMLRDKYEMKLDGRVVCNARIG